MHSLSLFYFFLMQISWRSSFGLESIAYLTLLHLTCEELHCSVASQVFLGILIKILIDNLITISPPAGRSVLLKSSGRDWRCLCLTSVIPVLVLVAGHKSPRELLEKNCFPSCTPSSCRTALSEALTGLMEVGEPTVALLQLKGHRRAITALHTPLKVFCFSSKQQT